MYDKYRDRPDEADRLPTISIGVWIVPGHRQRIVEHQLSGLKADPVVGFVGAVLFFRPDPTHETIPVATDM